MRRVGGEELIDIDMQMISATNEDLEEAVASDRFRDDLYYRLKVISVSLPPFREPVEDILLLVDQFLDRVRRAEKNRSKRCRKKCWTCCRAMPGQGMCGN